MRNGGEMRFLADHEGASVVEAIAYVLVVLAAAGAAIWGVYQAVANKFNSIASGL
jgi:Flp pilus assembly pilin Flp